MARSHDLRPVETLRRHNKDASVKVLFAPASEYPQARTIADLFELAGWRCSFNSMGQERPGYPYSEGIEVSGVNGHLVKQVASALVDAEMPGVRTSVTENRIAPSNPKYAHVVRSIRVHVGYPVIPPERIRPGRRQRAFRWVREWTKPPVLVGIVGVLVAYIMAAKPLGWWPF